MKNNSKKILAYKILILFLLIGAICIGAIIINKHYKDRVYDKENKEVVEQFEKLLEENKNKPQTDNLNNNIQLTYRGHNVIGLIEIPVINLKYPILEKTTKETMNISISRFYGGEVNGYGNISLAGHNNYSDTMFGRNDRLKIGDTILLTDLHGNTITYEIYDIFVTNPNDTSILKIETVNTREVTLITCKEGNSKRLIIKAKQM